MESVALGIDQAVFRDRIIVFAHTIFDVYLVWEVQAEKEIPKILKFRPNVRVFLGF